MSEKWTLIIGQNTTRQWVQTCALRQTVPLFTATGDFGLSCTETTEEKGMHYPAAALIVTLEELESEEMNIPLKDKC